MPFSLFDLAQKIEHRVQKRRSLKRLNEVQSDPHLARDIGVPYRPREPFRIDTW